VCTCAACCLDSKLHCLCTLLLQAFTASTVACHACCRFIDSGKLVADKLIISMIPLVLHSIAAVPKDKHVLLDGFPRTLQQAVALYWRAHIHTVINLDVSERSLMQRLTDRWITRTIARAVRQHALHQHISIACLWQLTSCCVCSYCAQHTDA
jgi:adenylate kinase family enzyme